jgi:hypothetical protein
MNLGILNKKFESLEEKERLVRMTYDVRGTNTHQHRFIQDLKEDFKEEFLMKYSTKSYGKEKSVLINVIDVGLMEQNNSSMKMQGIKDYHKIKETNLQEGVSTQEAIESSNPMIKKRHFSAKLGGNFNKARPISASNRRPITASTIRPQTATSKAETVSMSRMFGSSRPVSAINKKNLNYESYNTMEYNLSPKQVSQNFMSLKEFTEEDTCSKPSRMKVNESLFWKNTKKYDVGKLFMSKLKK